MRFQDYLAGRHALYTGRGSTCIHLALEANGLRGEQVLLPANICYAAVLAVTYSGNTPVFADIGDDGNLTDASVAAAASGVRAAVIPHMYGNPCREIAAIIDRLHRQDALVIEDCALAMGAAVDDALTGTFGDYAIFSFGYSKTIDCGYGGLLVSERPLDSAERLNSALPLYGPKTEAALQLFSQVYRVLRNNPPGRVTDAVYACARNDLRECFVCAAERSHVDTLAQSLVQLDETIRLRRRNVARYQQALSWNSRLQPYAFGSGAVPWRFNVLIDPPYKAALVAQLLRQRIPVSDWYPVIAPMFGDQTSFPRARAMEQRLLNFPVVGVSDHQIDEFARWINEFTARI